MRLPLDNSVANLAQPPVRDASARVHESLSAYLSARERSAVGMAGVLVFAAAFLFTLPAATGLIDDHFMHVARGRQMLKGSLPVRDVASLGMPLQSALSAAAEYAVGYRLLSEALLLSTAFGAGAVLTFLLATRVSGSLPIGVVTAAVQLVATPRTYSYPKIVVYAAGIALAWRYIRQPSMWRLVPLALLIVVALYLRHDHGLYLSLVVGAVLVLRHAGEWRVAVRRLSAAAAICLAIAGPYALYIQRELGITQYVRDLSELANREYQQNRFEQWPEWPLASVDDVVTWTPGGVTGVTVGIRWSPDASDEERRAAARRYRLELEIPEDAPVEAGRFRLADLTRKNVVALVHDPAIDDTSGIDRPTGTVLIPGLRFGALHLFPGLDSTADAAAFLFYACIVCIVATTIALLPGLLNMRTEWEHLKIAAVLLVATVAGVGFIREPLAIRVADAFIAPLVLMAWWAGRACRSRTSPRTWVPVVAMCMTIYAGSLVARSAVVIGDARSRLTELTRARVIARQLTTTPPFDSWPAVASAKYGAAKYVRACTPPDEPLLVLWFAPDLYYYADRPFAGRFGFYMEGYWASPLQQRLNIEALERSRPAIALMEDGRDVTDLYTFPLVLDFLAREYREVGRVTSYDGNPIRVFVRGDRQPTGIYADRGWPCFVS